MVPLLNAGEERKIIGFGNSPKKMHCRSLKSNTPLVKCSVPFFGIGKELFRRNTVQVAVLLGRPYTYRKIRKNEREMLKDGLIEGDVSEARGIRVRGRWKIGLKVDGLCKSRHLTQYLPTGVSMVRIRLRRSFPLLAWWCALLVLGHSGITARSSESGASYHYQDRPGTKKKKNRVADGYKTLFFENRKSNNF